MAKAARGLDSMIAILGRTVEPDADPEKGYYYRSDHFEFAKQGIPALDPKGGTTYLDRPAGYGKMNWISLAVVVGCTLVAFVLAARGYNPQAGAIRRVKRD